MEDGKEFTARYFHNLSRKVPGKKLKQLKFLLQDVMQNAVLRDKTFLEVITELQTQNILQRSHLKQQDGHLLCEIFDALSLTELANGICQDFEIERGNIYILQLLATFFTILSTFCLGTNVELYSNSINIVCCAGRVEIQIEI